MRVQNENQPVLSSRKFQFSVRRTVDLVMSGSFISPSVQRDELRGRVALLSGIVVLSPSLASRKPMERALWGPEKVMDCNTSQDNNGIKRQKKLAKEKDIIVLDANCFCNRFNATTSEPRFLVYSMESYRSTALSVQRT